MTSGGCLYKRPLQFESVSEEVLSIYLFTITIDMIEAISFISGKTRFAEITITRSTLIP